VAAHDEAGAGARKGGIREGASSRARQGAAAGEKGLACGELRFFSEGDFDLFFHHEVMNVVVAVYFGSNGADSFGRRGPIDGLPPFGAFIRRHHLLRR
jgi:hypothetical protein